MKYIVKIPVEIYCEDTRINYSEELDIEVEANSVLDAAGKLEEIIQELLE